MDQNRTACDVFQAFQLASTFNKVVSDVDEDERDRYERNDDQVVDDEGHYERPGDDHHQMQELKDENGDHVVHVVGVFGEAVEDATERIELKELDRGCRDRVEELLVHAFGHPHAHEEVEETAEKCEEDACHGEAQVCGVEVGALRVDLT